MSNLSDIGFDTESEEDFYSLLERAYQLSTPLQTAKGTYCQFSDKSGAELWMQLNEKGELIGMNPHFRGQSNRKVSLTASLDRPESILDGAFHAWAAPAEQDNPESGEYPFVFDLPNHKQYDGIQLPQFIDIQLSAFAQEIDYFESEDAFAQGQEGEPKWASQSFVPSGLFSLGEGDDPKPPEALGLFAGIIQKAEKRCNEFTNQEFYWMLVDTLGGEIDVLADLRFFDQFIPQEGGVIHGQFWLSGILLTNPKMVEQPKTSLFRRLFRNK